MFARLWILVPRGRRSRRAPVPQRVDAPHARIHAQSARAAVRGPGAVQFALGEQGRRYRGPCGTRCPATVKSYACYCKSLYIMYRTYVAICLSEIEHKVRTSIKTLMYEADTAKYKSPQSIHFKDHLKKEDGTPSAEVEGLLHAALKANGYKPGIYEFGGEEEDAREGTTRLTCLFVIP